MPIFLASLWGGLINIVGTLAGQVLVALGVSVIAYSGISVSLAWLKSQALMAIQGLPADMIGMLAYLGVGEFISIVTSAMVARLALDGLTAAAGGTIKKFVKS